MKAQHKLFGIIFYLSFLLLVTAVSGNIFAQEQKLSGKERDTLLSVARQYMDTVRYCALVTVDSTGYPHVRMMDPFQPDDNMIVWLGTNRNSRKVQEIRNNPRVALFYADDKGTGYVSIIGKAGLVDDAEMKAELWKPGWERFYKNKDDYILIKVIPGKLEILNYKHAIFGDKKTWRTPSVEFNSAETGN
jgi:general stress protein 26